MTLDYTDAQFDSLVQELKKRLGLIKLFAKMGDSEDLQAAIVDEPGRKGFVRVRLQNDDVPYRTVKSGLVGGYTPDAGTPVVLGYDEKGKLAVEKMDHDGIRESGGNPLIYNTGDRRVSAFTATDGLMPLLTGAVSANAGVLTNEIFVDKFRFSYNNTVKEYAGARVDLDSLVPAAGLHRYVGIFLRLEDLVIEAVGSTAKATITPLTDADKQECYDQRSALTIPVALWRLSDDQTSIAGSDKVEDLRPWLSSLSTESGAISLEWIEFVTSPAGVPDQEGAVSWNSDKYTLDLNTGLGPVMQVGQEMYVIGYNGTGSQIDNGSSVYPVGAVGGVPSFALANATTHVTILGVVLVSTMDIPDGQIGIFTQLGQVNGVDASGTPYSESWSTGDTLWVSADFDGGLTNVRPELPDYRIQIGGVADNDNTDGILQIDIRGAPIDTSQNFWNGAFREQFDFLVTSDGATITGTLTPSNGHDDMTMMFSDGFTMLDTSPGASITLTAGANDETPQRNYVYIPQSTKVLTLSTSAFPTDIQHIRVAEILLITAATTQLEGSARRNQNWNDELADTTSFQGHLSHIGEWIRAQPASYVRNTGSVATLTGTTSNVYIASAPGDIMQFHRGTFPPQDMTQYTIDAVSTGSKTFTISGDGDLSSTFTVGKIIHVHNSTGNDGHYHIASVLWSDPDFIITVEEVIPSAVADGTIGDFIIVINDSVTALYKTTNLNYLTVDSEGAILNNKWFNLVIWGVRNKSNELSYMMCNLPSGSYTSEANAIADALNYSNYTIPDDYNGVGFLIARFTLRKSSSNFTYNGGTAYVELRGTFPSTAAGGGGGGAGGGTMSSFTITGDSGTPETIVDGDAIDIAGGTGISTVVSTTDTVTVNVDDDYVLNTGDTMTGNLLVETTGSPTIEVKATSGAGSALIKTTAAGEASANAEHSFLDGATTAARLLCAVGNAGGSRYFGFLAYQDRDAAALPIRFYTNVHAGALLNQQWNADGSINLLNGTTVNEFSIDGTLAGDSDDAVPTEKAVKAYVDATAGGGTVYPAIPSGRLGLTSGVWDDENDVTGAILYYVGGGAMTLYDTVGAAWIELDAGVPSLSLAALAANSVHYIFGYDNSGTFALENLTWGTGAPYNLSAATAADPCVITYLHTTQAYAVGDTICLQGITGNINTLLHCITTVTAIATVSAGVSYSVTVELDTTGLTYTSGGTIRAIDNTPATAITQQNGFDVKTGDASRFYLGTIVIGGDGGESHMTDNRQFVGNRYNKVHRKIRSDLDAATQYTVSGISAYSLPGTPDQCRDGRGRVSYVVPYGGTDIHSIWGSSGKVASAGQSVVLALEQNNIEDFNRVPASDGAFGQLTDYCGLFGSLFANAENEGFNYIQQMIYTGTANATIWVGDTFGSSKFQYGMTGYVNI